MGNSGLNAQIRVGVFGAASRWSEKAEQMARAVGEAVALSGAILVTGATTGLPHLAGKAALEQGGFVLGISPAKDIREHVEVYGKPLDGCSLIAWTGLGYSGRNMINIRNCDAAIFIGGETGTLQEFCIGHYEGKILGVLEGSGGVTNAIKGILAENSTSHGEIVIFERDPKKLMNEVLKRARRHKS